MLEMLRDDSIIRVRSGHTFRSWEGSPHTLYCKYREWLAGKQLEGSEAVPFEAGTFTAIVLRERINFRGSSSFEAPEWTLHERLTEDLAILLRKGPLGKAEVLPTLFYL